MDVLSRRIPEIWEIVAAWENYSYLTKREFRTPAQVSTDIASRQKYINILKQSLYEVAERVETVDNRLHANSYIQVAGMVLSCIATVSVVGLIVYMAYLYIWAADEPFGSAFTACIVLWFVAITLIYASLLFWQSYRSASGLSGAWSKVKQKFAMDVCRTIKSVIDALDAAFQEDIDNLAEAVVSSTSAPSAAMPQDAIVSAIEKLTGTNDIFSESQVAGALAASETLRTTVKNELDALDKLHATMGVLQYSTDAGTFAKTRKILLRSAVDGTYDDNAAKEYLNNTLEDCVRRAAFGCMLRECGNENDDGPLFKMVDGTDIDITVYVTNKGTTGYQLTDDDADVVSTQLQRRLENKRTYYGMHACLQCYGKVPDSVLSAAMTSATIKQIADNFLDKCDPKLAKANSRQLRNSINVFVGGVLTDLNNCFLQTDNSSGKCDAAQLACLWSTIDVDSLFQMQRSMRDAVQHVALLYNTRLTHARIAANTQARDRLQQRQLVIILGTVTAAVAVIMYVSGIMGNDTSAMSIPTIGQYIVYTAIGALVGYMFVTRSIARVEYNELNMRRNTRDVLQQATDFSDKIDDLIRYVCLGTADTRQCRQQNVPLSMRLGQHILFNATDITIAADAFMTSYINCNYLTFQASDAPRFPLMDVVTYVVIICVCGFVLSYALRGHSMSFFHIMKTYRRLSAIRINPHSQDVDEWKDRFADADMYDSILETVGLIAGLIMFCIVVTMQSLTGAGDQYAEVLRSLYQVNRRCVQ
jgi:hypothetical protein